MEHADQPKSRDEAPNTHEISLDPQDNQEDNLHPHSPRHKDDTASNDQNDSVTSRDHLDHVSNTGESDQNSTHPDAAVAPNDDQVPTDFSQDNEQIAASETEDHAKIDKESDIANATDTQVHQASQLTNDPTKLDDSSSASQGLLADSDSSVTLENTHLNHSDHTTIQNANEEQAHPDNESETMEPDIVPGGDT